MTPAISFTRMWLDEGVFELRAELCDGNSLFVTPVSVGQQQLADTVSELEKFKHHIHGGLFNLRWGEFGPEYANGALDIRMHFRKRGKLLMQILAQSEFSHFEGRDLASDVTLYIVSEPALLDNFIEQLRLMSTGSTERAELEGIGSSLSFALL